MSHAHMYFPVHVCQNQPIQVRVLFVDSMREVPVPGTVSMKWFDLEKDQNTTMLPFY